MVWECVWKIKNVPRNAIRIKPFKCCYDKIVAKVNHVAKVQRETEGLSTILNSIEFYEFHWIPLNFVCYFLNFDWIHS